ncbi:Synapsin, ATP binding domain protein, partial [Ostertagia ostertagi]
RNTFEIKNDFPYCEQKKQLRKLVLADNSRIPLLPTIHYPHFHRFHQPTTFPVVISVNEGYQGIGKIKVNSHEELCDIEGVLQIMGKGDTEVEVEPYVDLKFDVHVQKIGHEIKTFLRRGISKNWKSNVGSAVLEQLPTNERHKQYIHAICEHVGRMSICSIDILVSKEGREYVHDVNDVIAYFGESQEDDRRNTAALLRAILAPAPRLPSRPSMERPKEGTQSAPFTMATRTIPLRKKPRRIPEKRSLRSNHQLERHSPRSRRLTPWGPLRPTLCRILLVRLQAEGRPVIRGTNGRRVPKSSSWSIPTKNLRNSHYMELLV